MNRYFSRLNTTLRQPATRIFLDRLLTLFLILGLFAQIAGWAGDLRNFSAPRGIVEAHDNDAGKMVEVAGRARWYNDTGFRYYGPMYFRIAHTLEIPSSWSRLTTPPDSPEAVEEGTHFALLLTSMLGLLLISATVAVTVGGGLSFSLLLTLILGPVLLMHPTWRNYLWTAHPDILLSGICVLGFFFFTRWLMTGEYFRATAWTWAGALSTKASSLFFVPGLAASIWLIKQDWKTPLKRFMKLGLIAYFVWGFPGNLDVFGTASTLGSLTKYSEGFTLAAFINWWAMWFAQAGWASLIAVLAAFWVPAPRSPLSWKNWAGLLLLSLTGFFLISLKDVDLVHDHYVMPFAALAIVAFAWFARTIPLRGRVERPAWLQPGLVSTTLLTVVVCFCGLPNLNLNWRDGLKGALTCRPMFEKTYAASLLEIGEGHEVLATPYTPLPLRDESKVHISWDWHLNVIGNTKATIFIMNTSYASRFLGTEDAAAYVQKNNPEWREAREFFHALEGSDQYTDTSGRLWHRQGSPDCSLAVWKR